MLELVAGRAGTFCEWQYQQLQVHGLKRQRHGVLLAVSGPSKGIDEVASAMNIFGGPCSIFVDMLLGVVTLQSFNDQGITRTTSREESKLAFGRVKSCRKKNYEGRPWESVFRVCRRSLRSSSEGGLYNHM